jgi:hypothetical protein
MTSEQLCALALAAIDSDNGDGVVVLADAINESGWWHPRLSPHRNDQGHYDSMRMRGDLPTQERDEFLGAVRRGASSVKSRVRPILAVLLFGEWPTSWPLAERCRLRPERRDIPLLPEDYVIRVVPPSLRATAVRRTGGWSVASDTQDDD